jgi:hypothetical protein
MGVCLILCCVSPLHAQNLPGNHSTNLSARSSAKTLQVSRSETHARGEVSNKPPLCTLNDVPRLQSEGTRCATIGSSGRDMLDILRKPTPDRRMAAAQTRGHDYEVKTDSLQNGLLLVASLYREAVK